MECKDRVDNIVTTSAENNHHKHTTEACTPFCICSCCPASAFYQPIAILRLITPVLQQNKVAFEISFISKDFHSIWQPPKLG